MSWKRYAPPPPTPAREKQLRKLYEPLASEKPSETKTRPSLWQPLNRPSGAGDPAAERPEMSAQRSCGQAMKALVMFVRLASVCQPERSAETRLPQLPRKFCMLARFFRSVQPSTARAVLSESQWFIKNPWRTTGSTSRSPAPGQRATCSHQRTCSCWPRG